MVYFKPCIRRNRSVSRKVSVASNIVLFILGKFYSFCMDLGELESYLELARFPSYTVHLTKSLLYFKRGFEICFSLYKAITTFIKRPKFSLCLKNN